MVEEEEENRHCLRNSVSSLEEWGGVGGQGFTQPLFFIVLFHFTPIAEVAEKGGLEDRVLLGGNASDNVGWRGFRREGFQNISHNISHAGGGRAAFKDPPPHLPGAERGRR